MVRCLHSPGQEADAVDSLHEEIAYFPALVIYVSSFITMCHDLVA
jgi:hypothetical protein